MSAEIAENPFGLEGKTILITGASSGIGRECCRQVARAGGVVYATGRNPERLAETMSLLEPSHLAHRHLVADLVRSEERGRLAETFGGINGIVHCAGVVRVAPLRFSKEKVLREMWEVNTEAPLQLTREFQSRKLIREDGSLVFLSSVSALAGIPGHSAYAASKAAIEAAVRPLANELAKPSRIRCNVICPGLVETPMVQGGEVSSEDHRRQEKHYPLGFGRAEDVAMAAVYFLSPASRWITGQRLILDGGASILG